MKLSAFARLVGIARIVDEGDGKHCPIGQISLISGIRFQTPGQILSQLSRNLGPKLSVLQIPRCKRG